MSTEPEGGRLELGEATVRCGPEAALYARRFLESWLDGRYDARLRDDACLLVSELVSNSVRHAGQPPGAPVRITATARAALLRVAVEDKGDGRVLRRPPDPDEGGFGLTLVDRLAARWDSTHEQSTEVWFELTATAGPA
jgi:anti-sigma regulatory factor (Ser/Thr protein kinase)